MKVSPVLCSDSYKQFHVFMYPENLEVLYSNGTPRSFKHIKSDRAVFFYLQYYVKEYLINQWNELFFDKDINDIVHEYKRFHKHFSGVADIDTSHIEELHALGYLPLRIKALPEGAKVKEKVPFYTIYNTVKGFGWLVNFLETQMSTVIWRGCVIATIGYQYRKLLDNYAIMTIGSTDGVQWQGHDFSMRGLSSMESTYAQAAWLLSFTGTDTIPAVLASEEYYGADIETELVAASVPATEHSVMTSYGKENEIDAFKRLLKQYPAGILSVVSDSFDLWKVCTEFMVELKEEILSRDGKLVIRPDSGDPVEIICGKIIETILASTYEEFIKSAQEKLHEELEENTPHGEYGGDASDLYYWDNKLWKVTYSPDWSRHDKQYYYIDNYGDSHTTAEELSVTPADKGVIELLWDVFGGTITEQGYKVLNPKIGAIYGDSINLERADEICSRLKAKGFASTNIVFGTGSYSMQMVSRDSIGFAVKSTYCEVAGEGREIFKDPITDDGTKKSAKGLLAVHKDADGEYYLKDQCTWEEEGQGELQTVFLDGVLVKEHTLQEIRYRMQHN